MPWAIELPVPTDDPETVRRTAEQVLSRPEFAVPSPSPLTRARQWVFEQIGRILESLLGTDTGSILGAGVLLLAVIVLTVLAVRFVRGMRPDPERAAAVAEQVGRPASDWDAEAQAHAAAGRWREAVRCRYRGLVAELAARGVVEEVPGRTSGEYLVAVRTAVPPAAESFAAVTLAFEMAWYGHADVGQDEDEVVRDEAEAVLAALDRRLASARA